MLKKRSQRCAYFLKQYLFLFDLILYHKISFITSFVGGGEFLGMAGIVFHMFCTSSLVPLQERTTRLESTRQATSYPAADATKILAVEVLDNQAVEAAAVEVAEVLDRIPKISMVSWIFPLESSKKISLLESNHKPTK